MAWQKRKKFHPNDSNYKFDRQRSPLHELTSDPETVGARIFFGSFSVEITKHDLEEHFSKWGKVLGITCNKTKFGFVQFEKDSEAQNCLKSGPFTTIKGEKLSIKAARVVPSSSSFTQRARSSGYAGTSFQDMPDQFPPNFEGNQQDDYHNSFYNDNGFSKINDSRQYGSLYPGDSQMDSRDSIREPLLSNRDYNSYGTSCLSSVSDPLDPSRPNDAEIVVPNKSQRAFAESLEASLKRSNLLVDLLFPPPEITLSQVLRDLAARQCLYVLFATPENEEHNSVTVHILHGEPQEHRNMPVNDALNLINHNFEEYVRKMRFRNERQVVPGDIRSLLLDLIEMRPVSMGDLDKMIKYLRQRQNALVDDQIELKREITGNHSSAVAAAPRLNNMTVTYPGFNYMATSAMPVATAALAAVPGPPPEQNPPSHSGETAQPSVAGYGIVAPYGLTTQVVANNQQQTQGVPPPQMKDMNMQNKILGVSNPGMSVPSPVAPPPNTVPGHPNANYVTSQHPVWLSQQPPANDRDSMIQGGPYNPFSH